MRILLWHGYLLTGSGSNVYTANLARAWRRAGHDVLLMCQEHKDDFPFIDRVAERPEPSPAGLEGGRVTLLRPDIGRLLPVYVYDDYEGFDVKEFVDLSDAELREYTDRNVEALAVAVERFEPDIVIVGHEVMGPYIAARALHDGPLGFTAKLHGSALEYAVKKQDRYLHFATSGLTAADVVVGGSRYMIEEASAVVPGWSDRAVVVNPGCDVHVFDPIPNRENETPIVGFVGKLIAQKGVQRLLAALTLVRPRPLQVVIVGYGGDDAVLRRLAGALTRGDLNAAADEARELGDVEAHAFLISGKSPGLVDVDVRFTGRLEHGPLAEVLPKFDALAVPSVVAEAFGMVAAEAAASGVLPIVPGHSGIAEAGGAIEDAIGRPGLLTYDPDDPIVGLAKSIDRVLGMGYPERHELEAAAVRLARSRWSWDEVARALLEAANPR